MEKKIKTLFLIFIFLLPLPFSAFSNTIGILYPFSNSPSTYEYLKKLEKSHPGIKLLIADISRKNNVEIYKMAQQMVRSGARALIGPYNSEQTFMVLHALRKMPVPVLPLYATDTNLFYQSPYFFSLSFSNKMQAASIVNFVKEHKNHPEVVVMYSRQDRYALDLVFWLQRYFFRHPEISTQFINMHHYSGKGAFSLKKNLSRPVYLIYISANRDAYAVLNYYIQNSELNLRCTLIFPDGLETNVSELKKYPKLWNRSFWFTYFSPRFFIQKTDKRLGTDRVFLKNGIQILRKAFSRQRNSNKTILEILESDHFRFSKGEPIFGSLHFRKIPVYRYRFGHKGKIIPLDE